MGESLSAMLAVEGLFSRVDALMFLWQNRIYFVIHVYHSLCTTRVAFILQKWHLAPYRSPKMMNTATNSP